MAYPYQKKPGGTWYVGYRDEFGEQVRVATKAKTKTEARHIGEELERKAERIRLGLDEGVAEPIEWTVLVDRYMKEAAPRLAAFKTIKANVRKHVREAFAGKASGRITAGDISALVTRKLGEGLKPGSVEQIRLRISAIFSFAALNKLVRHNPASEFGAVEIPQQPIRYLEPHEIPRLIEEVPRWWRLPVALAALGGLRKGEVAGLSVESLDFLGRSISVEGQYEGRTTKTRRSRLIPMPEPLIPGLQAIAEVTGTGRLFPWMHEGSQAAEVVQAAATRAGIHKRITFKDLRSTWATLAYEMTGDLRFVQKGLGHTTPTVTDRRYADFRAKRALQLQNLTTSHPGLTGISDLVSLRQKTAVKTPILPADTTDSGFITNTRAVDNPDLGSNRRTFGQLTGQRGAESGSGVADSHDVATPGSHRFDPSLTVAEVAAHLGVSEKAVRTAIRNGLLPARRRGRYLRILTSDLEAYKRR